MLKIKETTFQVLNFIFFTLTIKVKKQSSILWHQSIELATNVQYQLNQLM